MELCTSFVIEHGLLEASGALASNECQSTHRVRENVNTIER